MSIAPTVFNLLTPDQRALLAVKYQPVLRTTGTVLRYYPGLEVAVPAAPYPAISYTSRVSSRLTQTAWFPQPTIFFGPATACGKAGLTWKSCYYTYQATLKTDRDGAPYTYGPYPCGSGVPPNPPGKQFESPFCPGAYTDNYGCGALANQVLNVANCPRQPNKKGVPLEHICNATNNVNCSYADISQAKFTDASRWVGTSTDSGFEECDGNGKCAYQVPDKNGDTIGKCQCDDGWWGGLINPSCPFRDCVKLDHWNNTSVQPCYGHGQCHHGFNPHDLGT